MVSSHARTPALYSAEVWLATLFLMCGLPGSGRTTLAKQIERGRDAWRELFEPPTPDEPRPAG